MAICFGKNWVSAMNLAKAMEFKEIVQLKSAFWQTIAWDDSVMSDAPHFGRSRFTDTSAITIAWVPKQFLAYTAISEIRWFWKYTTKSSIFKSHINFRW